jgi:hypothetical protein
MYIGLPPSHDSLNEQMRINPRPISLKHRFPGHPEQDDRRKRHTIEQIYTHVPPERVSPSIETSVGWGILFSTALILREVGGGEDTAFGDFGPWPWKRWVAPIAPFHGRRAPITSETIHGRRR